MEHNHEWKESENGELFHPESDPRILQEICPACKEYMQEWEYTIQAIIKENR